MRIDVSPHVPMEGMEHVGNRGGLWRGPSRRRLLVVAAERDGRIATDGPGKRSIDNFAAGWYVQPVLCVCRPRKQRHSVHAFLAKKGSDEDDSSFYWTIPRRFGARAEHVGKSHLGTPRQRAVQVLPVPAALFVGMPHGNAHNVRDNHVATRRWTDPTVPQEQTLSMGERMKIGRGDGR